MRLVIAEKPSVAQSIAAVLGAKSRHDGYLEGGGYIVSWCFGHLAELADAAVYNADDAKWTLAALPIIPTSFRFIVRADKQKQFDILRELMRREDVTEVVNACDAGREGELIFRTVYCLAGCSKPILRLWISSMEDDAIRSGFQQLKSGRDYDGLHQSALCRAKADWLVGINATRYFSLTYGRTLNIGRVMSPTLALLVQREAEISAFVAEPFYTVQLDCGFPAATDGDDGIHIATGDTSRYLRSAQVIGWADAAERIEELLDGGTFATNLEVTEAPRYERLGIAVDVWNLYHDFSDEAKSLGYLSCLGNIHSTSFPEETERLTDDLLNPEFRERLLAEHRVFLDAYRENRELLRFHFHRPQALLTRMEDLSLPRKEYHSDMAAVPKTGRFITEDEIAASLANGSGFEGGKARIHEFFQTPHTTKESADFLKKEYGIGGRTHAVSRESGSYEDHGSKGIVLKKNGCADIQMNWNKVASRISELVLLNRYLTPDEQAAYDKEMAQDAMRNAVYNDYNDVKAAHPDEIVLYQVGDFFELYGEDARAVADDLSLELTRRNLEGVGRVTMCGFPAKDLEKYVEKLREKNDVTISRIGDSSHEHTAYTLPSIDHEAEQAINAYEAEFGADGTRVFRDPAAELPPQPTVRELFDGYKLTVGNSLSKDTAFVNACRNSDRQNAYLEGADAIRRIVMASDDLQLVRLYFDMPAFHNRLHQELLEELYPTLAATVAPSPYQITQEDIDNALLDWHNNLKGKQEVALYMQAHGRERSTAAWLAAKYGWEDSKTPMYIHVGNAEPVTLTWAQVQRRLAQLIRENKFYDENERLRLFSPDRYSIRLHPGEGGITGIWDEVLERFCGDGEQTLRFAEQNNAIAYLDGIKRDMGIELSPPAFTTPLGYTYHIGDRISSIELDHIAAVGVIARVDEDHVWHTLPNVPGQEPVSIDRNSFERYLDTRYFEVSEPEPQRVIAAQHTEQPTPETPQAVQNLMGQRVEIDGKLYNVDSADETVAHCLPVSCSRS